MTDTTLELGDGADEVVVGSAATCTAGSCTNPSGVLSGIDAPLTVNGGSGSNTLDLDDTNDDTGDTLVLTSALIDGLDLHADGIAYSSIAELDIRLGSGGDTVSRAVHLGGDDDRRARRQRDLRRLVRRPHQPRLAERHRRRPDARRRPRRR